MGKSKIIDELFSRGVTELIDPQGLFREKVEKKAEGKYQGDIVIKFGVDPTRPDIHLGHAVVFRRLRKFQDIGCKVIFLVGDYTSRIGDPSGKSKVRPEIEQRAIEKNMQTYLDQVGKILRTEPEVFSWIRNSDWFDSVLDIQVGANYRFPFHLKRVDTGEVIPIKPNSFMGKALAFEGTRMQIRNIGLKTDINVITLNSLLWSLKHITHSCLVKRDMFQERIKKGEELYMHEMLYPVLQGIDSFVLSRIYGSCDLEIGGSDQTFNMLMGRDVMRINNVPEQAVMTLELLEGTDGKEKMSKSLDNYIAITDSPTDMYGKIMSVKDSLVFKYFVLCGVTPPEEIERIKKDLEKGAAHPRDVKMRLAREIVSLYHGQENAEEAEEAFIRTFQQKEVPANVEQVRVFSGARLADVLSETGLVRSKGEFRRLIKEGAVRNVDTGEKIQEEDCSLEKTATFKIGKRRFLKIVVEKKGEE